MFIVVRFRVGLLVGLLVGLFIDSSGYLLYKFSRTVDFEHAQQEILEPREKLSTLKI